MKKLFNYLFTLNYRVLEKKYDTYSRYYPQHRPKCIPIWLSWYHPNQGGGSDAYYYSSLQKAIDFIDSEKNTTNTKAITIIHEVK